MKALKSSNSTFPWFFPLSEKKITITRKGELNDFHWIEEYIHWNEEIVHSNDGGWRALEQYSISVDFFLNPVEVNQIIFVYDWDCL